MSLIRETFTPKAVRAENPGQLAIYRVGDWFQQPVKNAVDWVSLSRRGLSPEALDRLLEHGFSKHELNWIIAPRTLSHRRSRAENLTPEESGRLLRAAKIQALAEVVFGDLELAVQWLSEKRNLFNGLSAKELMQTEQGGRMVEDALGQLDAGYFA